MNSVSAQMIRKMSKENLSLLGPKKRKPHCDLKIANMNSYDDNGFHFHRGLKSLSSFFNCLRNSISHGYNFKSVKKLKSRKEL